MGTQRKIRRFRASLAEETVEIESNGKVDVYTIRQLDGATRDAYMDELKANTIVGSNGKYIGLKSYAGHQSGLLAKCLFGPGGKLIPEDMIQRWPAPTINGLFEVAQELNMLNVTDEVKEAVKND